MRRDYFLAAFISLITVPLTAFDVIAGGANSGNSAKPVANEAAAGKPASDLTEPKMTKELDGRLCDWNKVASLIPKALQEAPKQSKQSNLLLVRDLEDMCVHYESERQTAKLLSLYKEVLALDDKIHILTAEERAQKYADLGHYLSLQGKAKEAIVALQQAVKLQSKETKSINYNKCMVDFLSYLAAAHSANKDAAAALAAGEKARGIADACKTVSEKPRLQATALRTIGSANLAKGDLVKAKAAFDAALKLDTASGRLVSMTDVPRDMVLVASVHLRKKDNVLAEQQLKAAVSKLSNGGNTPVFMFDPILSLADFYLQTGNAKEADNNFKTVLNYADKPTCTLVQTFNLLGPLSAYENSLRKSGRGKEGDAVRDKLKHYKELCDLK